METSRLNIVLQGVNIEDGARICAPHFKVFHQKKETKSSRGNFGKPAWKSVKQTQQIKSSLVHCRVQRKVVVGHSRQEGRHNSLSHVAAQEHLSSNLSSLISSSLPSTELSMKQVDMYVAAIFSSTASPIPTLLCSTPKQSTSA